MPIYNRRLYSYTRIIGGVEYTIALTMQYGGCVKHTRNRLTHGPVARYDRISIAHYIDDQSYGLQCWSSALASGNDKCLEFAHVTHGPRKGAFYNAYYINGIEITLK